MVDAGASACENPVQGEDRCVAAGSDLLRPIEVATVDEDVERDAEQQLGAGDDSALFEVKARCTDQIQGGIPLASHPQSASPSGLVGAADAAARLVGSEAPGGGKMLVDPDQQAGAPVSEGGELVGGQGDGGRAVVGQLLDPAEQLDGCVDLAYMVGVLHQMCVGHEQSGCWHVRSVERRAGSIEAGSSLSPLAGLHQQVDLHRPQRAGVDTAGELVSHHRKRLVDLPIEVEPVDDDGRGGAASMVVAEGCERSPSDGGDLARLCAEVEGAGLQGEGFGAARRVEREKLDRSAVMLSRDEGCAGGDRATGFEQNLDSIYVARLGGGGDVGCQLEHIESDALAPIGGQSGRDGGVLGSPLGRSYVVVERGADDGVREGVATRLVVLEHSRLHEPVKAACGGTCVLAGQTLDER